MFVSLFALAVALATLTPSHATIFCSTPLVTQPIETSNLYKLTDNKFGTSVVAAGAYVMVLFNEPLTGRTFSQFSFNHGVDFPSWTRKPFHWNHTRIDLVTDSLDILAIGEVEGQMRSMEFSMGEFIWSNITESNLTLPGQVITGVSCTAKPGQFVCVLTDSPQPLGNGYDVVSYSTNTRKWVKFIADDAPLTTVKMSIATDKRSFMMCGVGSIDHLLHCGYTPDGVKPVVPTLTTPFEGAFDNFHETLLASNGVNGTYFVVYKDGEYMETRITRNLGTTWVETNHLGYPARIPDFLIYTDKLMVFHAKQEPSGVVPVSWQNQSTPFVWGKPQPLLNNATLGALSVTSAHFQDSYHVFYQGIDSGGLQIKSCIPSAPPTVKPSPSPTSSNAMGMSSALLVTMVALLVAYT